MPDYCLAFWNVENLFDAEDYPERSEKLARTLGSELRDWTSDVLDQKIHQLASIISQMNGGAGPDVLGVCEIENRHVLELLVGGLDGLGRNYQIVHDDCQDRRGIDVAFVYDAALFTAEEWFSHFIVKRLATRDLLQVNFRTNSNRLLVLIGNHWPSRSGGQRESEPYRIIAGETLAYFHERIRQVQENEHVPVLAMGDLNDEPFDRAVVGHALSRRTRSKVTRARSPAFLNLMWPVLGAGDGTYYYDNTPNVLDQFLASRGLVTGHDGIGVDVESVEVLRYPGMAASGTYPVPVRFGRPSGDSLNPDGFSDHYPIAVRLSED